MLDSAEDKFTQPHERSIFETVAKAYDNAPLEFPDDPFSATYIVRNCIRAVCEQRVWWDQLAVYDTGYRNVWNHQLGQSSLASEDFENRMAINNQALSEYQQPMGIQEIIRHSRHSRHSIRANLWTFRLRDTCYLPEKTPELERGLESVAGFWLGKEDGDSVIVLDYRRLNTPRNMALTLHDILTTYMPDKR